jgi:hypothetical protein
MYCSAHRRGEHFYSRVNQPDIQDHAGQAGYCAMVSLRCTLVEILTPIKLPNSYSLFGLIAAAGGASRTRARRICRRDGGEAADAGVRRPFAKGRSEAYNFKRSPAVDSL